MSELARLAYRFHIELSSNKARSSDRKNPRKHFFRGYIFKMVKQGHFEVLRKKSSTLPRVVWAEESKNGLRFEIGPSYDDVPMTSQCPTDEQPSCRQK